MLDKTASAHALAILVAVLYLGFHLLGLVSRQAFVFLFNAQFFGADVASLLPREFSLSGFLGTFVALVATSWLLAYGGVWLYNKLRAGGS
jgi:hypothetical protein